MSSQAAETSQTAEYVLLRGLGREARHWGEFPDQLVHAIPGSRVLCLDLPGAGEYADVTCPLTIEGITDFVRGRLREKGFFDRASRAHLIALSLGGMVASDWLHRYPDDFKSCVLINTSFKSESPIHHRLTVEALGQLLKALCAGDELERERHVLELISNRSEIREEIAKVWAEIGRTRPMRISNFLRQLWAASRFSPRLTSVPVPLLILGSRADRMVHPSCSQAIARRWGLKVVEHPSAGHDLPLDEGAWVAEKIRDFANGF
jgi:pimeloyl-ACP methyl ester carboxylesterase